MCPRRVVLRFSGILCLLFAMAQSVHGDLIPLVTGTSFNLSLNFSTDNLVPHAVCRGRITPGGTDLDQLTYLGLETESGDVLSTLREQRPDNREDSAAALVYNYIAAENNLTGTMSVDWYKAIDRQQGTTCVHGAEIVAYYDYGSPTESALGLSWIQLYVEHGGSVHRDGMTVDGPSNKTPAYYSPTGSPWPPPGYTLETTHDLTWSDGPEDEHFERNSWAGGIDFAIFLAGFGTPTYDYVGMTWVQDITLYDGVMWGYEGICVPEPSTLCLIALGTALMGLRRKFFG